VNYIFLYTGFKIMYIPVSQKNKPLLFLW